MNTPQLQSDVTTYAAALSSVCDGRVRVVADGRACTDGDTIHLPRPQDFATASLIDLEAAVQAIYGIACHEAAHIYYGSPQRFRQFVDGFPLQRRALAAGSFNAVLDVADETRFERRFGRGRTHFTASTTACARKRVNSRSGDLPLDTFDDVLVAAILRVRIDRIEDPKTFHAVLHAERSHRLVRSAVTTLCQAITQRGKGKPNRTESDWKKLCQVARELVTKVRRSKSYKKLASGKQSGGLIVLGDSASESAGTSQSTASRDDLSAERNDQHSDKPTGSHPTSAHESCQLNNTGGGGVVADIYRELIAEATNGRVCRVTAASRPLGSAFSIGGFADVERDLGRAPLDGRFHRYARQLLSAPTVSMSRPSSFGPHLGDLVRWKIDGRALVHRAGGFDTGTAIAICLDCSGSMGGVLLEVASVAASMGRALREAGGNVGCWHFGSNVKELPVEQMHCVRVLGGTSTHLAITAAREWLIAQPEQRRVLSILDEAATPREWVAVFSGCMPER